jgi:XTP/dITP diphosphohydrolase
MAATPQRLVLATRNPHKLREFERLLGPILDPLPEHIELPPETGATFTDNALPKARAAARATGRPAIADDSGIEAEALNGAPGVRSARFAGPDASDQQNLDKLIKQVPPDTSLRYVCSLAFVDPTTETEQVFSGESRGAMAPERKGTHGFGYDPVFIPTEHNGRTMAELTDAEKDAISHRGRAARALMQWLHSQPR